jgi:peptidoglycan/LPS O-acetylase OafA/YrhL
VWFFSFPLFVLSLFFCLSLFLLTGKRGRAGRERGQRVWKGKGPHTVSIAGTQKRLSLTSQGREWAELGARNPL